MFRLFKKREQPSAASGIWLKMGTWLEKRQRLLAGRLNQRAQGWSRRSIKIGLVIFCILYSSISIYTMFIRSTAEAGPVHVDPINVPEHAVIPSESQSGAEMLLSADGYQRLLSFNRYMDSLQQSPEGREVYQNIIQERPGLRDSVRYIISLYQKQVKRVKYGKQK